MMKDHESPKGEEYDPASLDPEVLRRMQAVGYALQKAGFPLTWIRDYVAVSMIRIPDAPGMYRPCTIVAIKGTYGARCFSVLPIAMIFYAHWPDVVVQIDGDGTVIHVIGV